MMQPRIIIMIMIMIMIMQQRMRFRMMVLWKRYRFRMRDDEAVGLEGSGVRGTGGTGGRTAHFSSLLILGGWKEWMGLGV